MRVWTDNSHHWLDWIPKTHMASGCQNLKTRNLWKFWVRAKILGWGENFRFGRKFWVRV